MDNELLTQGERIEFSQEIIQKRGVIKARYWSWAEPRMGLVTYAGKGLIKVLFLTGVNAATSYYTIRVEEVNAGLWEINFSPDLETFYKTEIDSEDDFDLPAGIRKLFEEGD